MERDLLEVLCCPVCHGELGWVSNDGEPVISNGALACQGCGKQYLLEVGLPVLGDRESIWRASATGGKRGCSARSGTGAT